MLGSHPHPPSSSPRSHPSEARFPPHRKFHHRTPETGAVLAAGGCLERAGGYSDTAAVLTAGGYFETGAVLAAGGYFETGTVVAAGGYSETGAVLACSVCSNAINCTTIF